MSNKTDILDTHITEALGEGWAQRNEVGDALYHHIKNAMDEYASLASQEHREEWVRVEDRTPELIPGKDYSENVFAILGGKLRVMAYCYIDGFEDEGSGYAWCDCGGDIYGDPYFDGNYYPTHWMPLPTPPTNNPPLPGKAGKK